MTDNIQTLTAADAPVRSVPCASPDVATDHVYVLFTSSEETLAAARVASRLARALGIRATVVHFRPIGFGAQLEAPSGTSPVETEEFRERLEAEAPGTDVRVYLCRDARQVLPTVLKMHSLVLLGRRRRPWPTAADRWRRTLEAAGHFPILVDEKADA